MSTTSSLAIAVKKTANRKVGKIAVTHAAQQSCPTDCVFKGSGCYAENGPQGWITKKLNTAAAGASPLDVALAEAAAIRTLPGNVPLRLHVVGDCPTEECARVVAEACTEYIAKDNQPVWTYTHAWRTVNRDAWGSISVLASCETPLDVAEAHARGYATALVVDGHPSDKLYEIDTVAAIPCPQQTRGVTCDSCRLCFNDEFLRDNERTIAFDGHGATRLVRQALERRRAA